MADRRSLVEGLKTTTVDPSVEKEFVLTGKAKPHPLPQAPGASPAAETRAGKGQAASAAGRVPLTTRIRGDYASALKRASLERQLSGAVPNTLQDILEEALQPWLRTNGYLT